MLAVQVDYESRSATIGTARDTAPPETEILAALESVGYRGEFATPGDGE